MIRYCCNIALVILACLALTCSLAAAQAPDKPVIGILRFGYFPTFHWMEGAILDTLALHGWINAEERAALRAGDDLENQRIEIFWGDADYDFANASLLIDEALDREPRALVTMGTPLTQTALTATSTLEQPPALIFAGVYNAVEAGIIDSTCLKPAHVTGVEAVVAYEEIVPLLRLQHPDLKTIGTIYTSAEATGAQGAEAIKEIAESLGLSVKSAAVVGFSDVPLAAEGLFSKGVEAILLPYDLSLMPSIPLIADIAADNDAPLYQASLMSVYGGATMSAGPFLYYEQGAQVGRLLIAHMNGALDIARTSVHQHGNLAVAVNLDNAAALGLEISEALLAEADVRIVDGETLMDPAWGLYTQQRAQLLPVDEQAEADREFLAELRCTDALIAEQKAALADD